MYINGLQNFSEWLFKQGYPTKPVQWAISPLGSGRIAYDAWSTLPTFSLPLTPEDVKNLPMGIKLAFRLVGGRSIRHATFQPGNVPDCNTAIIPPEIVKIQNEVEARSIALDKKEQRLIALEDELYKQEDNIRKSTVAAITINSALDIRTKNIVNNLKDWEEHNNNASDRESMHIQEMSELIDSKAKLAEKNAVAAQIGQVFDKIAATVVMSRVKKYEDLPAGMIADFQQYLVDRADRRFFDGHPDPVSLLGDSFTRFPDNHKVDFASGIIKWTIVNKPQLLSDMAREVQEEVRLQREEANQEESDE